MSVPIVGEGGPHDPNQLLLWTKRRRQIPNSRRKPLVPQMMAEAVRMHSVGTRDLRSASSEYNCVGMVFASRRTFIDIAELQFILDDDGYQKIHERNVKPGDLLLYAKDNVLTHIGVVWSHKPDVATAQWDTRILSQWGQDGEYFHDAADVSPFLGRPYEFWTDRITVD